MQRCEWMFCKRRKCFDGFMRSQQTWQSTKTSSTLMGNTDCKSAEQSTWLEQSWGESSLPVTNNIFIQQILEVKHNNRLFRASERGEKLYKGYLVRAPSRALFRSKIFSFIVWKSGETIFFFFFLVLIRSKIFFLIVRKLEGTIF